MIKPEAKFIREILSSSIQYEIPIYQRDYKWSGAEAEELINDLKERQEAKADNLFLGTIILESSKDEGKKAQVVDGQQRLTTIILLLIACRERAKVVNQKQAVKIHDFISYLDSKGDEIDRKLIPSKSIKETFDYISNYDWAGDFPSIVTVNDGKKRIQKQVARQRNKIKPIYDFFFYEHVSKFDRDALGEFVEALLSAYVVKIDIDDPQEAFMIFERTNARGVDLEVGDLLKNYLFKQSIDEFAAAWDEIVENSEKTLLRMIKYFIVSKNGYTAKVKLYKEVRDYAKEIGVEQFVEQLMDFSKFYKVIRSASIVEYKNYLEMAGLVALSQDEDRYKQTYYSIEGLREFKVSQIFPLLYSAVQCFIKCGHGEDREKSKELVRLFESLEKFHFINTAIGEMIGNKVEKEYARFCKRYYESTDFKGTTQELISWLKSQLISRDVFVSKFQDPKITGYSTSFNPMVAYIFDRFNNYRNKPGERVEIFKPDPSVFKKSYNTEHFFPQNSSQIDANVDTEYLHSIGNLLLISKQMNSSLGNLTPSDKMKLLEGKLNDRTLNLAYLREFISDYSSKAADWSAETIKSRTETMAKRGYNEIWKID